MTLEEQLAASQAREAKLREALKFSFTNEYDASTQDYFDKALAQPTDTSALQQAIDAAYERAAVTCLDMWNSYESYAYECAEAIRELKGMK